MLQSHSPSTVAVRAYWDERIHDIDLGGAPGSAEFFAAMDAYRLEKAPYLTGVVNFAGWPGRDVLEIGCGAGLDLMRFARGGAHVTGVDISSKALELARQYFAVSGQSASFVLADGASLPFPAKSFDLVYCHGVIPFAPDPAGIVSEARRVLRSGGEAILMVYNRHSWVALAAHLGVPLGHADAPGFRTYSRREFGQMLHGFDEYRIQGERLPAASSRRRGSAAWLFNRVFVPAFEHLPERLRRASGWHWLAFCRKTH
jgi:SAM-dependent methyltransferase